MPRGGRRPGAGAPKRNLNAVSTGKHSARVRAAIDAIMADPHARNALINLVFRRTPRPSRPARRMIAAQQRAVVESALGDTGMTYARVTELQRIDRITRRSRRFRAMLAARMERQQRIDDRWPNLLAAATSELIASLRQVADQASPSPPAERGPGGEVPHDNQLSVHDPASEQTINGETAVVHNQTAAQPQSASSAKSAAPSLTPET